jgi:hypothetical protein
MGLSDWKSISFEQLAEYERAQGTAVVKVGDHYWYSTRPCFYQTLAPVVPRDPSVIPPRLAMLGGFKFCVPPGTAGNATMAFLKFDKEYALAGLDRKRRRYLQTAEDSFVVRRIETAKEFGRDAHEVYLDFQRRTRYALFSARRHREVFDRWAHQLYAIPPLLILGAYRGSQLHAVSICYWLYGLMCYAAFFSSTQAQRLHVADLMLHHVRETARCVPGIGGIVTRTVKGSSHDEFYLQRGAKVDVQPARVYLNPVVSLFLKHVSPRHYRAIWGVANGNGAQSDLSPGASEAPPVNLPISRSPIHGRD